MRESLCVTLEGIVSDYYFAFRMCLYTRKRQTSILWTVKCQF